MIGSFLTRGLVMIFGYAYPAYECFKTVEKNKPEIEQLRFWCQYWILVALLTVFERVGDAFVSWVPMYSEAKLAFFIYLWYPKTKGTTYVYDSFFRPYVAKHEPEIDRNLLELKTRAGDLALFYCQRAATYGHTKIYDILHYVASQSTVRSQQGAGSRIPPSTVRTKPSDAISQPPQQPPQLPQQAAQLPQEIPSRSSSLGSTQKQQALPPSRSASTVSTQQQQPPSRTSSTGTTNQPLEKTLDKISPVAPTAVTTVQVEAKSAIQLSQPSETNTEAMQNEEQSSRNPPPQDTVMEEVIRVTRGRLRKNRSVGKS